MSTGNGQTPGVGPEKLGGDRRNIQSDIQPMRSNWARNKMYDGSGDMQATGVNINRHVVENVRRSSLQLEDVENLGPSGNHKLIRARRSEEHSGRER